MSSRLALSLVAVASLLVLVASPAFAGAHKYTGVKDCSRCHKKELIGDQYEEWKKGPHSKAFETLKGAKALEIAKQKGISTPPHETDDCLKCHATAHTVTQEMTAKKPLKVSDSVQCESCHGPGADYRKKKIMSDRDKAIAAGMWEPGKNEKICLACHNDGSPTWDAAKGFDYAGAKKKIAHPIPEDVKGHYLEIEKKNKQGGNDE
jgi:hypothetical protein